MANRTATITTNRKIPMSKFNIIEAIKVMRNGTGKLRDEYTNRIEAHGIEQPSIDALIAEIDSVDNYLSIQVILNKYRGQK